jgi:hypothetical protein
MQRADVKLCRNVGSWELCPKGLHTGADETLEVVLSD